MSVSHSASTEAHLVISEGECVLTYERLDVESIMKSVSNDAAGATAVFIGTTRNSFKGRTVTRLEYQAYSKLAIQTMANILRTAAKLASRSDHQLVEASIPVTSLTGCALWHRLGTVPVGEPSIVIAVSSPHRREAFRACEHILEEVKLKAQIWKREYFEGDREEDAEWKANN